jgi:hypothetical protein
MEYIVDGGEMNEADVCNYLVEIQECAVDIVKEIFSDLQAMELITIAPVRTIAGYRHSTDLVYPTNLGRSILELHSIKRKNRAPRTYGGYLMPVDSPGQVGIYCVRRHWDRVVYEMDTPAVA